MSLHYVIFNKEVVALKKPQSHVHVKFPVFVNGATNAVVELAKIPVLLG